MKIIVTGCKGQLGTEIIKQLREGRSEIGPIPEKLLNATVIAVDLPELDISNYKAVDDFVRRYKPDVIINCAAYTNVDGCETNHDAAYKANALGPRNLAQAAEKMGSRLVHVSTDYVFSGRENGGIPQDEACLPDPISAYGSTKLMGEKYVQRFCHRHFIVRTAWLYSYYGKNFVKTIVNAGKKYGKLEVVNDQLGNPTNAVRHPRVRAVPLHRRGHLQLVRLCLRDHPSGRRGRHRVPLHQRRVQGKTSRQRRPPPLERPGQPCPALLGGKPGAPLAGGPGLLLCPLGRRKRHEMILRWN